MNKVTLHQFPQSHYCIRIRWLLNLKKVPFEVKNYTRLTLGELEKLTNGWRMVPVLEWGSEIITDSPKIARFIEAKIPTPSIYPPPASAALCDMINCWCDKQVMMVAAKLLVKEYLAYLDTSEERNIYIKNYVTGQVLRDEGGQFPIEGHPQCVCWAYSPLPAGDEVASDSAEYSSSFHRPKAA